uniref:Uncharacterized protein n=1 Tax=Anopheles atroparvus TaxID=41427 RepID=A0A182IU70_ANOAO
MIRIPNGLPLCALSWALLAGALIELAKNYVCMDDFCDNYRENSQCDTLKTACRAQNSTHNGIIFPSATPCSCCQTMFRLAAKARKLLNSQYPVLTSRIVQFAESDFNVLQFDRDVCQPDGFYDRIQQHPTGGYKYCADKDGALIERFQAPVNTRLAATMTCSELINAGMRLSAALNRARKLLLDSKSLEVPECCPNGNYKSLACRRGECYCVDEDGTQVGIERPEKDKQNLPCYNGGDYGPLAG